MIRNNQFVNMRALLIPTAFTLVVIASSSLPAQQSDELLPLTTTQPAQPVQPARADSAKTNSNANANTSPTNTAAPSSALTPQPNVGGDPEPRREPDPTAVLRELTSQQNTAPRPVVIPNRANQIRTNVLAPEAIPHNAIKPVSNRLLPDGYRLVDRTGRLTREGDYYIFSFESRSEQEAEAPMRLLPNRLLEDMEDFSEGGTRPVVFVVSGEVTEYHGVNYLLLQKLLTRPNLGNLK